MRLRFIPLLLLLGSPLAVAVVDQNGDGMGDLWQLKFDAATLAPADDADGDGQTNRAEAGASIDAMCDLILGRRLPARQGRGRGSSAKIPAAGTR